MPYIGNPIYQSAFVVDQFSGNGSTTAFTMSVAPAGVTNVLVAVSGVLQDPSTYGVVGNTITFSAAPPSGTGNISCRYLGVPASGVTTTAYRTVTEFTATAGQTTFTPPSYTPNFINVYLNGVLLGSADYTATNGTTVVLATGASAGNLLTVESFLVSSVLNAIPNTAGSVLSSNISSGVTINFADGSASTPSITNDGDTNTGIFFPAADSIGFTEGGAEVARFDSSGNLGVGVNNPSAYAKFTSIGSAGANSIMTETAAFLGGGSNGLMVGTDGTNTLIGVGNSNTSLSLLARAGGVYSRALIVDSAGRVTTPLQPFFYARKTTGGTIASGTIVEFNGVTTNIGSHYNSSTYRFTAPINGVYSFTAKVWLSKNGGSYADFSPRVNGTPIPNSAGAYYDSSINSTGLANYIVNFQYLLNSGDYVDFAAGSNASPYLDNSGFFCGFLVG